MAQEPTTKAELLLGQLAIRKGVVTPDQVDECLAEQEACIERFAHGVACGRPIPVGPELPRD